MVKKAVTESIPDALVLSDVAKEISFQLPKKYSREFPSLFSKLEATKADIGIESFGISITSLEEVFMKITAGAQTDNNDSMHLQSIKCEGHGSSILSQIFILFK